MNKTNDFKYNLPAYSDPVDIEDLNDNFRGIDDALMAGLCKKDYTGNNMGSSDPSARKYAWAPWLEIVNDNEFDVVVTDRNAPVESEEATINIAAGQTFRKYINGRYYMNFYVQDQHDVTFKWFTNAETYINESGGGGGGTGTVTSVSVQGGSGSHLTGSGNPIETSGTITINIDEGYSIPSDNEQTAWDGKAADLKAEIDSSTYVLTLQLKDSSGNLIGSERTIDLPLETMVVDGEYDPQTKKIKLELKNGNYVEFSVADLVSGLQTELSASNKLDPDYIDYDSSHRAVSDTEKSTWNGKQNALTFDDTPTQNSNNPVKSGGVYSALAGKQASLDQTQLAAVNSGIDSSKVGQISTNQTNILYVADSIGKNLINIADIAGSRNATYVSTATSVTITSTNTYGNVHIKVHLKAGSYKWRCNVSNLSAYSGESPYIVMYAEGEGSDIAAKEITSNGEKESSLFTITEEKDYFFYIYARRAGSTDNTLTVSNLILCTKEALDISNAYTPYALPNYDLTRLEAEDRAALAEVVDSGAKNLATLETISMSASGSSTENIAITLKAGSYAVSYDYTVTGGNVQLYFTGGGYTHECTSKSGSGHYEEIITVPSDVTTYYRVYSSGSAATVSNIMVCTKAAFGVSPKFVPYRVPINGVYSHDVPVACSTTLTTTGIKFTATEKAPYRITVTAIYYNSIPLKLVIKYKTNSSANQLPFCTATHADGDDVSLIASGIISLDVGGEFEVFAQYASSTSNYFYVLVEKIG